MLWTYCIKLPMQIGRMYLPSVCPGATGINPVTYGLNTFFQPWYFDGESVHWGAPVPDSRLALQQALDMAKGLSH
jgi:hypothetical protein